MSESHKSTEGQAMRTHSRSETTDRCSKQWTSQ